MTEVLLGIDLGTSGAKAGLYTPEGSLLGLGRSTAYGMVSRRPGWSESDPEGWWVAVRESLAGACRAARVGPESVAAVGLSVFFPAVLPMDARGRALGPAILYNDQRSLEQAAALEAAFPPGEYRRRSGNGASPGTCAATSMRWLRECDPKVYEAAALLGFANTYLTSRLAGGRATDFTHSGLSGLVDIRHLGRWDPDLCAAAGIDPGKLPDICSAAEVVGEVTAEASSQTGLRRGTPVACGCGDAPCGSFGAGSILPGSVAYIAGSTDCVTMPLSAPLSDHPWLTMGYVKKELWLGIGTMTSAGMAVEWFAERFYSGSPDERRAAMTAEAEASEPGDVLFLPYLQGERTPVWDPLARGLFAGINLSTSRGQMARAVFEGTAFGLREVIGCLEERSPGAVSEVRAGGGPLRNRFWTQLKADILGKSLDVLEFQETGSLGAALLAARARGHYATLEEAAAAARQAFGTTRVEPGLRASGLEQRFASYSELYPRTRDLMHVLAAGG